MEFMLLEARRLAGEVNILTQKLRHKFSRALDLTSSQRELNERCVSFKATLRLWKNDALSLWWKGGKCYQLQIKTTDDEKD